MPPSSPNSRAEPLIHPAALAAWRLPDPKSAITGEEFCWKTAAGGLPARPLRAWVINKLVRQHKAKELCCQQTVQRKRRRAEAQPLFAAITAK